MSLSQNSDQPFNLIIPPVPVVAPVQPKRGPGRPPRVPLIPVAEIKILDDEPLNIAPQARLPVRRGPGRPPRIDLAVASAFSPILKLKLSCRTFKKNTCRKFFDALSNKLGLIKIP